jgi:hypothetical protein
VSRSTVRTLRPDGSGGRYLGSLGPVSALTYSYTIPGGCETMACTLGLDTRSRTDALDPGRLVHVIRGGSVVWDGMLAEPQQASGAWSIMANGSGTFGSRFTADYNPAFTGGGEVGWGAAAPDAVIASAISRSPGPGLNWLPSAVGTTAGLYFGQAPDPGAIMIDAMLTQMTAPGGLTWWIRRTPAGNLLQLFPQDDTVPTCLLVATDPAPRTLGGDVNAIQVRYCSAPDIGASSPARYSTVWALDSASIAKHGRTEAYEDLSSNGAMLATDAQNVGLSILRRYKRASYAGPFTARQGQLLTMGGQPRDLGCFWQGNEGPMVCKLLLTDNGWGGEVLPGSPLFLAGRYEYDDDAGTAAITPFQTMSEDFGGMLTAAASSARGRRFHINRHGHRHVRRGKHGRKIVTWTPTWGWGPASSRSGGGGISG